MGSGKLSRFPDPLPRCTRLREIQRILTAMDTNDRLSGAEHNWSRREQIVAAAALLFSEQGYHGTSMQDLGQRVGLLKGSLYAHVSSKEELLLEIVSTAHRSFLSALAPVVSGTESAPAKLRHALRTHVETAQVLGPLAKVYVLEARHLSGDPGAWLRQAHQRYLELWHQIVQQGMYEGSFRQDLDQMVATWLPLAVLAGTDGAARLGSR